MNVWAGKARSESWVRAKARVVYESVVTIPVTGVLLSFAFIWATVLGRVVRPWLDGSASGLAHSLVLSGLAASALCAYLLSVLRSPGYVPDEWQQERSAELGRVVEIKRSSGTRRKCTKCLRFKPPRAHHCRICCRCVLRMDHHCTWINNCVGHNNYRSFFSFLVHSTAALFHSLALLFSHALVGPPRRPSPAATAYPSRAADDPNADDFADTGYRTCAMILCMLLLMPVGFLLLWHARLVVNNKTTIEHHEGVNVKALVDREDSPASSVRVHPYDLGDTLSNVEAILGHFPLLWVCPLKPAAEGDGFIFPTRSDVTKPS